MDTIRTIPLITSHAVTAHLNAVESMLDEAETLLLEKALESSAKCQSKMWHRCTQEAVAICSAGCGHAPDRLWCQGALGMWKENKARVVCYYCGHPALGCWSVRPV